MLQNMKLRCNEMIYLISLNASLEVKFDIKFVKGETKKNWEILQRNWDYSVFRLPSNAAFSRCSVEVLEYFCIRETNGWVEIREWPAINLGQCRRRSANIFGRERNKFRVHSVTVIR